MVVDAARFIREEVSERVAQAHRQRICPPAWSSSIAASTFRLPNSPPPDPTSATWPALTIHTPRGNSPRSRNGSGAYWLPATGHVEMSENEWAKACNLRDEYWLYVVFDCATPHPAVGAGARPVCQAARQEPRVHRLRHRFGGCYRSRRVREIGHRRHKKHKEGITLGAFIEVAE